MRNARDEQGIALVAAIMLLTVMMGLGLGLLLLTDNQQKASAHEQASESAFNVAEAALNAQVGQLSRAWPGKETEAYPERCTAATTTATNGCPSAGSLSAGYPNISPSSCPAGTQTEKWESPLTNQWTTYVRDDGEPASSLFASATDKTQPTWDKNGDGKMWVRSVGVVQCRVVTLITLVSRQIVATNFPHNAVTANWFETSNNGNKVIVNTQGEASQSGNVSMRCNGFKGTEQEIKEKCKKWDEAHGQVNPDTTNAPASPSPTLSAAELEAVKQEAKSLGTYYAAGSCPSSLEATSGLPAYVVGPCNLSYNGGSGNSSSSPGFLVLVNGTLSLNGNAEFYGVIYAVNEQNSAEAVVTVHGNSQVNGTIDVDGNGGVSFGSSKENLVFEPKAINELKISAGATPTRNTFRVLPNSQ